MSQLFTNRCFIALMLFFAALLLRLDNITEHDLQPDEQHWTIRSSQLLLNLRENPAKATNHLGHPGVTPVLVMAFGQKVAKTWNRLLHRAPGQRWYIDRLVASRVAATTVSALVVPLIYLAGAWFIGSGAALMAAALLACDPTHIGFSHLAQLDTVLTTLVIACLTCYIAAVQTARLDLKLLSGVLWGLSIVTKPTAASLVGVFFVYRLLRLLIPKAKRAGEKTLLSWSDIGAVLTGQAVFAALFTRMWYHNSAYRLRLGIHSPTADFLYDLGSFFQHNFWLFLAFTYTLFFLLYKLTEQQRLTPSNLLRHSIIICGASTVFLIALTALPQVFENMVRFWGWVGNLSHMKHSSSHHVWDTSDYGYLKHFLIRLPEVALLGVALSLLSLIIAIRRNKASEKWVFLATQIVLVALWTLPLSTSGKQTWRYVLPVLPGIYILVGYGFAEASTWLQRLKMPGLNKGIQRTALIVIFGYQIWGYLNFRPYLETYINRTSVDFADEFRRAYGLASIGDTAALKLLYKEAIATGQRIFVSTTKDASLLRFSTIRMFPERAGLLVFGYYPPTIADYLLINPHQWQPVLQNSWPDLEATEPLLRVPFKGIDLLHLYAIPEHDWREPITLYANRAHRTTAKVITSREEKVLFAKLGRDQPGALMMSEGLKLIPGNYQLKLRAWIPERSLQKPHFTPDQQAITLTVGKYCRWNLYARDLLHPRETVIPFSCTVTKQSRVDPSIAWHGLAPVMLHSISIGLEPN